MIGYWTSFYYKVNDKPNLMYQIDRIDENQDYKYIAIVNES